jgi:hypothetical protein
VEYAGSVRVLHTAAVYVLYRCLGLVFLFVLEFIIFLDSLEFILIKSIY